MLFLHIFDISWNYFQRCVAELFFYGFGFRLHKFVFMVMFDQNLNKFFGHWKFSTSLNIINILIVDFVFILFLNLKVAKKTFDVLTKLMIKLLSYYFTKVLMLKISLYLNYSKISTVFQHSIWLEMTDFLCKIFNEMSWLNYGD